MEKEENKLKYDLLTCVLKPQVKSTTFAATLSNPVKESEGEGSKRETGGGYKEWACKNVAGMKL